MSTSYVTEPPPTASIVLHTTSGPIQISLFTTQTPLACRNFIQHLLDGYYTNTIFHRIVPGFVLQAGDPTNTGSGGQSIYEDKEFETVEAGNETIVEVVRGGRREKFRNEVGNKVVFGDEVHSRLRFNRRGLLGMAKMDINAKDSDGGYGSQFFITLGDCRAQLDGTCTLFGRVEGDGIYNVMKIAEGELVEGSERPLYPINIIGGEVLEMPKGMPWDGIRKRERVERRVAEEQIKAKKPKKKAGKALLSFGGDEGDDGEPVSLVKSKKAKFNHALIDAKESHDEAEPPKTNGATNGVAKRKAETSIEAARPVKKQRSPSPLPSRPAKPSQPSQPRRQSSSAMSPTSASPTSSHSPSHRRVPSFHDSTTQLPLRNEESPSTSPEPELKTSKASKLKDQIEALKASMRRDVAPTPERAKKKSALEALIPENSIRGRKRPKPGMEGKGDTGTMALLNAFRAKLDAADKSGDENGDRDVVMNDPITTSKPKNKPNGIHVSSSNATKPKEESVLDDEAALCDLHFIANCQSCQNWADENENDDGKENDDDNDRDWMRHALSFEKDRLGKDLTWKRKNEEELVVIDPREKEREAMAREKEKKRERNMERDRRR